MNIRRSTLGAVGGLALSSIGVAVAFAQASELYNPGEYLIDGIPPACTEFETLVTDEGPELIYVDGFATIVINAPVFDPLPTQVKLFVYNHTCNTTIFSIRDDVIPLADMLTTRVGIGEGWLTAAVAEAICETDMLTAAGWTMAPDAERCAAIYETMRQALR